MMISAEQIRGARAMLDWSQDMLAQESGLSLATIYHLEKGHQSPRSSTEIRKIFERKGFEFSGKNGISRRLDEHINYGGAEGAEKFYTDLLTTAKETEGEFIAMFPSQEQFAKALGIDPAGPLTRFEQLSKFAKVKCLLWDVHHSGLFIPYFQFRAAATKRVLDPFSLFSYGNKTALLTFDGVAFIYFVMTSASVKQDSLKDFAPHWNAALPIVGASPAK